MLGVFVVVKRCDQMRDRADEHLEHGLQAWAAALDSVDPDLNEAERAFEEAARHSMSSAYPLFCLSAVEEVRGQRKYDVPPSEDWVRAIEVLAAGEPENALELFERFVGDNERAALYVRLIGELIERR